MSRTFRGGVHVEEHKDTASFGIARMPAPDTVYIPLSQHIGAHCEPTVKVGERVLCGQMIGEVKQGLGCPVHASVSGTVKEIRQRHTAAGTPVYDVVIANDGLSEMAQLTPYTRDLTYAPSSELIEWIRRAGISGMGGATFPTYAKIQSALGKVDTLLINCAECEPYITANHRLLLEDAGSVLEGVKILLKIFGLRQAILAMEDNKADAAAHLQRTLGGAEYARVELLETKYPQGDERQLIYAITGKELPAGKLPADLGCVIFNAETCAAIYRAVHDGMPLIERIVTVAGDCVKNPKNLMVPIGSRFADVIRFCGGLTGEPEKLIAGGPMMGAAQWSFDTPVTKGTSAILVLSRKASAPYRPDAACIRCGRCIRVCPMHLVPCEIAKASAAQRFDKCEQLHALSCVECGSCSYICPACVPIVQRIRAAKGAILTARKQKSALSDAKPPQPTQAKESKTNPEKEEP